MQLNRFFSIVPFHPSPMICSAFPHDDAAKLLVHRRSERLAIVQLRAESLEGGTRDMRLVLKAECV